MHCFAHRKVGRSGIMKEGKVDNNSKYMFQPNFSVPAVSYIVCFNVFWIGEPDQYYPYNGDSSRSGPYVEIHIERYTYVTRQARGKPRGQMCTYPRRQENKSTVVYRAEPGDWFWTESNTSYRV